MERPDLQNTDPKVIAYIEFLERRLKPAPVQSRRSEISVENNLPFQPDETSQPAEGPTSINLLTSSRSGTVKRTHRHLYNRQHRGGMGIFDLDTDEDDPPACLTVVDDSQNLLLFSSKARVFRYSLNRISDNPVRSKGEALFDRIPLEDGESLTGILPERSAGYVALIGANGRVRVLRHHLFGEHLKPGTAMYPYNDFGPLASVCWTNGDGELLVVSQYGIGIRFNEKLILPNGDWAIKLNGDDRVVGITPVYADSNVFIIGADGKGTLRSMNGFAPNKSMGGSGKQLFKSNKVAGMVTVSSNDDLFIISKLSKIIRFRADEVPSSEGVVQGVICMSLRADEVTAVTTSSL